MEIRDFVLSLVGGPLVRRRASNFSRTNSQMFSANVLLTVLKTVVQPSRVSSTENKIIVSRIVTESRRKREERETGKNARHVEVVGSDITSWVAPPEKDGKLWKLSGDKQLKEKDTISNKSALVKNQPNPNNKKYRA